MILIDKYWEKVNNLSDVSRIIREYYNPELADELDKMIENIELEKIENSQASDRIEELEGIIEDIKNLIRYYRHDEYRDEIKSIIHEQFLLLCKDKRMRSPFATRIYFSLT